LVRIGVLHGKLAASDKDEVIGQFAAGKLDVLVATTVVEVGVDVPNATLMVIENAERFGIAQLHQLRGRVGRGSQASTCALVVRGGGRAAQQRCQHVASTDDGFLLAEYDLKERGPGELVGLSQSGYQLGFIDELDVELIEAANELAKQLTA
jgi:ATP-dependent DNA helicase RecG